MKNKKTRWGNILCDKNMVPFKLIVTDGEFEHTIPVDNSSLELVKKTAYGVMGVKRGCLFVTQILDDKMVRDRDKS